MDWKKLLFKFEQNKDWKSAIALMQNILSKGNANIDAYISINYLLMDILVEEYYDLGEHDYYARLLKKYFIESYSKFSNNPEFLFFIGKIACMSEWYFGIEIEEAQGLMKKAAKLDPENILYKWANYSDLDMRDLCNREKMAVYAKQALSNPKVKEKLDAEGAFGKYLWDSLNYWNEDKNIKQIG
ncbi:MAG: hypothetical protein LKI39_08060 [Bacteroides sp.]|jgi:hypothetical protein|nr:hypothetical protein [Bacteroides sp.]